MKSWKSFIILLLLLPGVFITYKKPLLNQFSLILTTQTECPQLYCQDLISKYEKKLKSIKKYLPQNSKVGFITNKDNSSGDEVYAKIRYHSAKYSLIPINLVYGKANYILFEFYKDFDFSSIDLNNYDIIYGNKNGLFIVKKRSLDD